LIPPASSMTLRLTTSFSATIRSIINREQC
jgi:hypothetical protein